MQQIFSLSFLCSLFGAPLLLVPSTLLCMHCQQHVPMPPKKLASCLIVTQSVLHKNPLAKLKPLQKTPLQYDISTNKKTYQDKIILAPLDSFSLKVISKSVSDSTLSNVKSSNSTSPGSFELNGLQAGSSSSTCALVHQLEMDNQKWLQEEESLPSTPLDTSYSHFRQHRENSNRPPEINILTFFYEGVVDIENETPRSFNSQSSCESQSKKSSSYNR